MVILWTLCFLISLDVTCGECNKKYQVKTGQAIDIVSQSYPYNVTRNVHCFYDFMAEFHSGNVIHVKVLEVGLTCDDQLTTLEVYDAFNTNPRFLGKVCQGHPSLFISPKERLYLEFKSSGNGSSGFKLRVEAVPVFAHCYKETTKIINAYHHPQTIISPYYPYEVAPNVHCKWLIKAPPGGKVTLEVKGANMKGSNDCSSFGLYIYDGKTNYDDERIAKICDHMAVMRSFTSSSVDMMVEFTSGQNVLHSGGGVKLIFRSSFADDEARRDFSLLYILLGVLLGVASYTVLMVIVRYVVLPARRKKASGRNGRTSTVSNIPLRSVSIASTISEPPPPYRVSDHRGSKRNALSVISWRLVNFFKPLPPSSERGVPAAVVNPSFNPGDSLENRRPDVDGRGLVAIRTRNDYNEMPLPPRSPVGVSADAYDPSDLYDSLSSVYPYSDSGHYFEEFYPEAESCSHSYPDHYEDACEVRLGSPRLEPGQDFTTLGVLTDGHCNVSNDASNVVISVELENGSARRITVSGTGQEDSQRPTETDPSDNHSYYNSGTDNQPQTLDAGLDASNQGYDLPQNHYDLPEESPE